MAIQVLISQAGPLPIKAAFSAPSDAPMFLSVNGSVWTQSANQMTGIQIQIDDAVIGTAQIFSNGNATHRAVVPAYIAVQLQQGSHSITLSNLTNTVSDSNDLYTAVLHY
jgi:hypothetical protein